MHSKSSTLLVLPCVFILAGCNTTSAYFERLAYWAGQHEDRVIQSWGVPSGTIETSDGGRIIEYNRQKNVRVPPITRFTPTTSAVTGTVYDSGGGTTLVTGTVTTTLMERTPGSSITTHCRTTFWINARGYVSKADAEGDGCTATPMSQDEKVQASLARQQNYKEIEAERAKHFKNRARSCVKGDEVRTLTYSECRAWGGKRKY